MVAFEEWGRVRMLGPGGSVLASWIIEGRGSPGMAAVDLVARLELLATRHGGRILLEASPALVELLDLAGLSVAAPGLMVTEDL